MENFHDRCLDPDPVCPERLDPDPVDIRPDPKLCLANLVSDGPLGCRVLSFCHFI